MSVGRQTDVQTETGSNFDTGSVITCHKST
jgi:hypothetical protein